MFHSIKKFISIIISQRKVLNHKFKNFIWLYNILQLEVDVKGLTKICALKKY